MWLVYRCVNETCPAFGGRWPVKPREPLALLRCPSCEQTGRLTGVSTRGTTPRPKAA